MLFCKTEAEEYKWNAHIDSESKIKYPFYNIVGTSKQSGDIKKKTRCKIDADDLLQSTQNHTQ